MGVGVAILIKCHKIHVGEKLHKRLVVTISIKLYIISTDDDLSLLIETFAILQVYVVIPTKQN